MSNLIGVVTLSIVFPDVGSNSQCVLTLLVYVFGLEICTFAHNFLREWE